MTTWATIADFQNRYDSRVIAQLSNDANASAMNSAAVQALLDDAASEVRSACLQSSVYTTAQLDALNATGDTQLIRLNCDLAIRLLGSRRANGMPAGVRDVAERAQAMLDALRLGKAVLNIASNRTADTPGMVTLTGLQSANIGDITVNEFWGNRYGTNTVDGPGA